ncbi:restriction endonuclease subunit S [uncultured Ruminococcus sp.]|uniref:restriction endonuclease subunit S n=1 Tax=uncultured Ruminococcus sp. TaxID=165186 RepID=UPI0025D30E4F|nr:restriction endonuclease subunit S [uncultured Ruminococcus sp.]
MAKLIDFCDVQYGYPFDSKLFSESEGMPLIRIRDVVRGYSETYTTEKYNEEFIVYEGDMLIGMDGEFNIAKWGKIPALLNQRVCRIIPKELVFGNYIYYAIPKALKEIEDRTPFVTVKHLSAKEINKIEIPLPPIVEQRKIAANLDKVTHTIDLCNAILEKLDLLVKSRFVEMFGDFENLINKWHLYRFSDVTINLDNTRKPIKDADRQKIQGIYPYYGATGIVDYLNDYRIEGEYLLISEDGKALEFRNKDIAFIAKGKIWVNNHAHVMQCKENMNMVFLMFYMNNRDISSWVTGIDQKKLNRDNLDKMPVGVPPLALQNQFAAFVEQTDKSKLAVKQVLEKAETLKKALMQEYFG